MKRYKLKPTNEEIDNCLNSATAWEEIGDTDVRGMTYEQGVLAGIRWAIGDTEDYPIETDPPEEQE